MAPFPPRPKTIHPNTGGGGVPLAFGRIHERGGPPCVWPNIRAGGQGGVPLAFGRIQAGGGGGGVGGGVPLALGRIHERGGGGGGPAA